MRRKSFIQEIEPYQLFTKNVHYFTVYFILAIILFIMSVSVVTVFRIRLDQSDRTKPTSKTLLIVSLSLIVLSILFFLINTIQYYRIFGFQFSGLWWAIVIFLLTSVFLLFLIVRDYQSDFVICPNNSIFSTEYNQCIPICPSGSYLDTSSLECISGCSKDMDCSSPTEKCVNGLCCDLATNTLTNDGQCCPSNAVTDDGKCCPSKKICGTECCLDPDAECDSTGQKCQVKCGNQFCGSNEICVQGIDFVFKCMTHSSNTLNPSCVLQKTETIPEKISGFFPSVRNNPDLYTQIKFMNCNPFSLSADSNCLNEVRQEFKEQDPSIIGWECGLPYPVQFQSSLLKGNCDMNDFLSFSNMTDKLRVIKADDEHFIVNQRINPLKQTDVVKDCKDITQYQKDCKVLKDCFEKCPFDNKDVVCQYTDNLGVIKDVKMRPRCNMMSRPSKEVSNKTYWTFISGTVNKRTSLEYEKLYMIQGNDESSGFTRFYLSAVGDKTAPTMQMKPWIWRLLKVKSIGDDNVVRSGDVVAIQSYESVGENKKHYDLSYVSVGGGNKVWKPSMNVGKGASSVEAGVPTETEMFVLYDDTYREGKILDEFSKIVMLKNDYAVSITNCGKQTPCMKGNVLELDYICDTTNFNPRNNCLINEENKCPMPILDEKNVQCVGKSGGVKPLVCRAKGEKEIIQGMCCDTKDFQTFLNNTKDFSPFVVCDEDVNNPQQETRFRKYCSTPKVLPYVDYQLNVTDFNKKYWQFHS